MPSDPAAEGIKANGDSQPSHGNSKLQKSSIVSFSYSTVTWLMLSRGHIGHCCGRGLLFAAEYGHRPSE